MKEVVEIDENLKVLYSVSFPAAGGLISPRDFVQVIMKEKCDDGTEVELSRSLEHCKDYLQHDIPATKVGVLSRSLQASPFFFKPFFFFLFYLFTPSFPALFFVCLQGMVRGDIKFSGITLKMTDKGVVVKYIINTDPKGYIMASVIQQAMKSVVTQHMTYWIKLCEAN